MQYVFSMTARMVTLVLVCAMALCVLLFLLGIEIGVRYVAPAKAPATVSASPAALVQQGPAATDVAGESASRSASDPAGASPSPASSNN